MIKGTLGDYGNNKTAQALIANGTPSLHEKLFKDVKHPSTVAKREKFLKLLETILQDAEKPERIDRVEDGVREITLEELLGSKKNVWLFKAALQEEVNSFEFREAVVHASTKRFGGTKKDKNIAIIVAGPSSSGKTFASSKIAAEKIGEEEDSDGLNYMVSYDGGIVRETSQIRKAIIQLAHIKGYGFIPDLKKFQSILDPISKEILPAAFQDADCSLIIPETFSKWRFGKGKALIDTMLERENTEVEFVEMREPNDLDSNNYSSWKDTIAVAGNNRAKLRRTYTATEIDLNIDASEIAESKGYGKGGFKFGVDGSKAAGKYFAEQHIKIKGTKKTAIKIRYSLILIKKDDSNGWLPAKNGKDIGNGTQTQVVSRKCYEAWVKEKAITPDIDFDAFKRNFRTQESIDIDDQNLDQSISNELEVDVQKKYMQLLHDKAIEKSRLQSEPLYDVQGKLLLQVELNNEDYVTLFKALGVEINDSNAKALLDKLIGFKLSGVTTVSLDLHDINTPMISDNGANESKNENKFQIYFYKQLESLLIQEKNGIKNYVGDAKAICNQYDAMPKGSIIALTQEFYFHLKGVARTYKKVLERVDKPRIILDSNLINSAHSEAMLEVNKYVTESLAKALIDSYENKNNNYQLSIADINKSLDKARKEITPIAHKILIKKIQETHKIDLAKNDILKKIEKHAKHTACSLTATGTDILHTNKGGMITLIQNSELTAHHREKGEETATRQIITHFLDDKKIVPGNKNNRIQIRVPSLAVKEHSSKTARVDDVETKLSYINQQYKLADKITGDINQKPKAFIYNLYTALNDRIDQVNDLVKLITKANKWFKGGETARNLQTQSADDILRGAHQYNAKQLNEQEPVFCFVQNISINHSGQPLRNRFNRPSIFAILRRIFPFVKPVFDWIPLLQPTMEEASLMADIALLHTLYDDKNDSDYNSRKIQDVMEQYKEYLKAKNEAPINSARYRYFSDTTFGSKARSLIKEIKQNSKSTYDIDEYKDSFKFQAKCALKRLIAFDLHHEHKYAKLVQSLSVFVEDASIGGCKSANERAQAINGRVAILDLVANNSNYLPLEEIYNLKDKFLLLGSANKDDFKKTADHLLKNLDKLFDDYGEQLAPSMISLEDQYAGAKLEVIPTVQDVRSKSKSFKDWIKSKFSSNYGEESSLKNLQQSKTGAMQAHKDASKSMQQAIIEIISEPKTTPESYDAIANSLHDGRAQSNSCDNKNALESDDDEILLNSQQKNSSPQTMPKKPHFTSNKPNSVVAKQKSRSMQHDGATTTKPRY